MFNRILDNQNPFWQYMGRLFDAVMLNLLWLVCSLPVVTMGASTAAVYAVLIAKKRDAETKTAAPFFKAFRENWKQGTLGWLLLGALLAFLGFDVWYFAARGSWAAAAVVTVLLLLLSMVCIWFFIVTAVFENTLKNTLANAAILALRHPVMTLGMLLVNAALIALALLSLRFFPVLFMLALLLGFGVCAFFHVELVMPLLRPYFDEEDPGSEASEPEPD